MYTTDVTDTNTNNNYVIYLPIYHNKMYSRVCGTTYMIVFAWLMP